MKPPPELRRLRRRPSLVGETTAFPLSLVAIGKASDDSSEEASESEKESISCGP